MQSQEAVELVPVSSRTDRRAVFGRDRARSDSAGHRHFCGADTVTTNATIVVAANASRPMGAMRCLSWLALLMDSFLLPAKQGSAGDGRPRRSARAFSCRSDIGRTQVRLSRLAGISTRHRVASTQGVNAEVFAVVAVSRAASVAEAADSAVARQEPPSWSSSSWWSSWWSSWSPPGSCSTFGTDRSPRT